MEHNLYVVDVEPISTFFIPASICYPLPFSLPPSPSPIIPFCFLHFQLSSFPGFLPAAGMTRPMGGNMSSASGSTAQPSNSNYFGFNSMTPYSSGLPPLNTAFGMPVAHMASPTQNTSHSALTMSNTGFSMANPRMVQPSTAGTLIGELSPMSLTGTVTPQAPVLQRPPLVWGTGTGAAGKGNNIF